MGKSAVDEWRQREHTNMCTGYVGKSAAVERRQRDQCQRAGEFANRFVPDTRGMCKHICWHVGKHAVLACILCRMHVLQVHNAFTHARAHTHTVHAEGHADKHRNAQQDNHYSKPP